MLEILTDIYTWPWFSEPHGYNFNGHLIRLPEGNLCVDPVETGADIDAIAKLGVARIVLTNRNHSRAANLVRARTRARVAIHPDDAPHARKQGTEIDDALSVGQRIGPLAVIGAPGKSAGEVALYWADRRILIAGDAVIGHPPGECGLLAERVIDDVTRLRQSVRALLALDFDTLLVGDGTPILTGAKDRLRALVERFPT